MDNVEPRQPKQTMIPREMDHGDFTGLGANYAQYRPAYAPSVRAALIGLMARPVDEIDAVDVGAGTGIWARMLVDAGVHSLVAVEPNADMRAHGIRGSASTGIIWREGTGEVTGLGAGCCDLLTAASSFHWIDFDAGTREFHRLLRPDGRFAALWNPRYIEANSVLVEIEDHIRALKPDLKRVSSGRSDFTDRLADMLEASPYFEDVVYLEGKHSVVLAVEEYLGVWRSVNDVRVQLGHDKFEAFLTFIAKRLEGFETIEATYQTRAWSARCR